MSTTAVREGCMMLGWGVAEKKAGDYMRETSTAFQELEI
jgi:hypothetical protein